MWYLTLSTTNFELRKVVIVRSNPINPDPRVEKIAESLSRSYSVTVLAWDRRKNSPESEIINERFKIYRLPLKAPYARMRLVLYYPIFWFWVLANLVALSPSIIHACDLEAVIPSAIYKFVFRCKLIFDSFDRYAMAFIPKAHTILYSAVHKIENFLGQISDALITVSPQRLETFSKLPELTAVVMNCPRDVRLEKKSIARHPTLLEDEFTVVYAGTVAWDRGLELLLRAIGKIENIRIVIAGICTNPYLMTLIESSPKAIYFGQLDYSDAVRLQSFASVIPLLYDQQIPNNQLASPNKLFEAMMLGIPVISNVCIDLIEKYGCGLAVEYNMHSIVNALRKLVSNDTLCNTLGINGRKAFEQRFNWSTMEQNLLQIYHSLSS